MYQQCLAVLTAFALFDSTTLVSAAEGEPSIPTAVSPSKSVVTDSAFNPAISLILDGKYRSLQRDPDTWQLGGFIPGGEEIGPGERGFGIDESELAISGNIDPYFYGSFTAAITGENETEVEEAFVLNTGLVPGMTIKFGRYFTALGYQNEQHAHAWQFSDLPLVHQALLGGQYSDDGFQLRELSPTPGFLEVGAEFGKGAAFPGSDRRKNGGNGGGLFVHVGDDVGISNSYRFGVSYRQVRADAREYSDVDATDTEVTNAFTGKSRLWAVDAVWKWAPNGDPSARNMILQAEYFQRKESGDLAFNSAALSGSYSSTQKGFYAQAIYQFIPRWRVGARYDRLDSGNTDIGLISSGTLTAADFPRLAPHNPKRATLMLDFSPSEFSRLRLQYARDESRFAEKDNQILLQYIMSIGAHGAHKF